MFPAKVNLVFEDIYLLTTSKHLGPCVRNLISGVVRVLKLILVFSASNTGSKRNFSKLHLINTYLRTTITQKRLNHYMILGIYPELVDSLNTAKIAEDFISRVD
jgi:hypothetical protein